MICISVFFLVQIRLRSNISNTKDRFREHFPSPRRFTTVFVDTRLWKTKHPRNRFQNFRQSCVLSTDGIEIHQSQPLMWPSDLLYIMLAGCDWWISIRSVDNMYDWRKFWKRFLGCFVSESRVSMKTVVCFCIISFSSIHSELVMFLSLKKTEERVDHSPNANNIRSWISILFVLS